MIKPPKPRTTLQRRAYSAMTSRLPFKFAALALALILWAIVSVEEPTEERVNVSLRPIPTDSSIIVNGPLPPVHAWVVGRGRDLFRLVGQPPVIQMPITSGAPETLTVRLTPEMVELPVDINARVREVQPSSVQLHLDVLAEKYVPVVNGVAIEHDERMQVIGPVRIQPESVLVTGPSSILQRLDSISTRRMVLRVTDSMPQPVPLDTAELRLRIRPSRVMVQVSLAPAPADTSSADPER